MVSQANPAAVHASSGIAITLDVRAGAVEAGWLTFTVGTPLGQVERRMIEATLRQCGGDRSLAANLLGISARSIYRREADWRGEE